MKNLLKDSFVGALCKEDPIVLIDVGASGGIRRVWRKAEGYLQAVGFEPDRRAFEALQKNAASSRKYINAALSETDGVSEFHLTQKQECSSALRPNMSYLEQFPDAGRYKVIGRSSVPVRRLSEKLLRDEGVHDADFLKLDTQGGDLKILKGAAGLLEGRVFGIDVEVEFAPLYEGQPLFSDIDVFLRDRGFHIFDMRRYYWKRKAGLVAPNIKGQMIFGDALYFKTYDSFVKGILGKGGIVLKTKILKAIAICQLYGKADYALYLAGRAAGDGILSAAENKIVYDALAGEHKTLPVKGRYAIANVLQRMALRLKGGEFHVSDEELGE
ncbi:MAG: FkbM family methyltransferase [Candidatus Omnitrophota bacterium]